MSDELKRIVEMIGATDKVEERLTGIEQQLEKINKHLNILSETSKTEEVKVKPIGRKPIPYVLSCGSCNMVSIMHNERPNPLSCPRCGYEHDFAYCAVDGYIGSWVSPVKGFILPDGTICTIPEDKLEANARTIALAQHDRTKKPENISVLEYEMRLFEADEDIKYILNDRIVKDNVMTFSKLENRWKFYSYSDM